MRERERERERERSLLTLIERTGLESGRRPRADNPSGTFRSKGHPSRPRPVESCPAPMATIWLTYIGGKCRRGPVQLIELHWPPGPLHGPPTLRTAGPLASRGLCLRLICARRPRCCSLLIDLANLRDTNQLVGRRGLQHCRRAGARHDAGEGLRGRCFYNPDRRRPVACWVGFEFLEFGLVKVKNEPKLGLNLLAFILFQMPTEPPPSLPGHDLFSEATGCRRRDCHTDAAEAGPATVPEQLRASLVGTSGPCSLRRVSAVVVSSPEATSAVI